MLFDFSMLHDGLMPASFRGIQFHMPDVTHTVGRRIVKTLFPGHDLASFEDFGDEPGPIDVSGLIIGDTYIDQARALEAALRTSGPGTLIHPWLGEMQVLVTEPASISFDQSELRVVRFEATFERVPDSLDVAMDTLASVLGGIADLRATVQGLVSAVLRAGTMAIATLRLTQNTMTQAAGIWTDVAQASRGSSAVSIILAQAIAQLRAGGDGLSAQGAASAFVTALSAAPEAIVSIARPASEAAVAPGPSPISSSAGRLPDPRMGVNVLLAAAQGMPTLATAQPEGKALALAAELTTLAAAAALTADLEFESRQDAIAWRDRITASLEASALRAAELAKQLPQPAGAAWRAIRSLKAAVVVDIDEELGRLPAVRTITPPTTLPVWVIAQHVAGDDPRAVVATARDIIKRNRIRHPGAVPPDPLEVLM